MSGAASRRLPASAVINLAIVVGGVVLVALLLAGRLLPQAGVATALPADLRIALEPVADGLASPVLLVGAGDGSGDRYVVEQAGRVMVIAADGTLRADPLLDISDRVQAADERGLLGLAVHPDVASNGRLFAAYTRHGDGATVLSELHVPEAGEAVSERTLLVIPQPYTRHKAGMLAFDRDGMLLMSTGDGGSGNDPMGHGLDRASLLGKLLRIDVDRGWPYAIPPGNGFAADPGARPEVHAIGLRNPWRFSIDRVTDDVYIGDVGQSAWEEVDLLPRGSRAVSFGWGDMEGPDCVAERACDPSVHRAPAAAYSHAGEAGRCAVIGGSAYRGLAASLPEGAYLYADHCSGDIWAVPSVRLVSGDAIPVVVGRLDPAQGLIQAFGEDDEGEIYVLTSAGQVLHVASTAAG